MPEITIDQPRWIGGVEPRPELLTATGTQILEMECREQPEKLRELIQASCMTQRSERHSTGCAACRGKGSGSVHRNGSVILFVVQRIRASSDRTDRPSFSVDAGEWLHYAQPIWKDAAVSVLLTASGESAELVELMKAGIDRPIGLICNNTTSTCWRLAENRLPVLAGPEYGNATKTYTNTAAAAILLASRDAGTALAGRCRAGRRDLRRIPGSHLCRP